MDDSSSVTVKEEEKDDDYYEKDEDNDEEAALAMWLPKTPFFVPNTYEISLPDGQTRVFSLNFKQKIYLTLETASSCQLANIYSKSMLIVILLSILGVVGSTVDYFQHVPTTCDNPACDNNPDFCPGYQICAPVANTGFYILDVAVLVLFAIDFFARLILVNYMPARLSGTVSDDWDYNERQLALKQKREPRPDPVRSWKKQLMYFVFSFGTLVDLLAILPAFILLFLRTDASSTSFFRIFRMFRIFKMSKKFLGVIGVFRNALRNSKDALIILAFSLVVAVIVLACIEYSLEVGTFTVNADYPTGEYINNLPGGQSRMSPYTSIPVAMYWAVITLSTIGYGDIYPVTMYGRGMACLAAVLGIIVIALPVTVLGSNFSVEYENYTKRQAEYRAMREALRLKQAKALAAASRRSTNSSLASVRSGRGSALTSRKLNSDQEWTRSPISGGQVESSMSVLTNASGTMSESSNGPVLTKSMYAADVSEMEFISSSNHEKIQSLTTAIASGQTSSQAAAFGVAGGRYGAQEEEEKSSSFSVANREISLLSVEEILNSRVPSHELSREELTAQFEFLKTAHRSLVGKLQAVRRLTDLTASP